MNISARCEYACRAMVELASHEWDEKLLSVAQIAEQQGIPEKYLVHIMLQLKRTGLVESSRGASGGYRLQRGPDHITLLDIIEAIDGPILTPLPVDDKQGIAVKNVFRKAAADIRAILGKITLRHVLESDLPSGMYYI
ncbi:MAG TPA: Rrf2 family transcriptional regulator [Candidatus Hydrogenedentes bacterium]|nr:Rrf2 family transcriptional regulator [Candidatus Hydrogenedentota bacterium]HOJ69237.1 Rrf2 family transcriptional regulator [Candidatus Hydrogenedentota bacterium]HOK88850.1 Rrf2 family transcriptional regulator [Candidatus Hydrogenedentota bacterium]HOV59716.1 Rrf2 family transcriptional regulator [Candidatus Hydrogenedentota bacterium]HPO30436.1 Rrf2 family transcriptional regulator [Candidatus Hydrogenedentota bacterium]